MIFANIQKLATEKGITISGLEKELEFSNGTIGKWKNSSPKVENLKKVAEYFKVSIEELLKEKKT